MFKKKKKGKVLKKAEHKVVELSEKEVDAVVGGSGLGGIKRAPTIDPDDVKHIVK